MDFVAKKISVWEVTIFDGFSRSENDFTGATHNYGTLPLEPSPPRICYFVAEYMGGYDNIDPPLPPKKKRNVIDGLSLISDISSKYFPVCQPIKQIREKKREKKTPEEVTSVLKACSTRMSSNDIKK